MKVPANYYDRFVIELQQRKHTWDVLSPESFTIASANVLSVHAEVRSRQTMKTLLIISVVAAVLVKL